MTLTLSNLTLCVQALNGQQLVQGGCALRIDYSHLHNLNVKYNNDKSRDFTNPHLPINEDGPAPQELGLGIEVSPHHGAAPLIHHHHQLAAPVSHLSQQHHQTVAIDGVLYSVGGLPSVNPACMGKLPPAAAHPGLVLDPADLGLIHGAPAGGFVDINGVRHGATVLAPGMIPSAQFAPAFSGHLSAYGGLPIIAADGSAHHLAPPQYVTTPTGTGKLLDD